MVRSANRTEGRAPTPRVGRSACATGKARDARALLRLLDEHDLFQPVAVRPSLKLDLGQLLAEQAATRIAEYIGTEGTTPASHDP